MSATPLFLSLIFGSIGFGYFLYGKKQKMTVPFIAGIILMIFPYFIENAVFMSIIGIVLSILPWLIRI